jgi:hypothetical protein
MSARMKRMAPTGFVAGVLVYLCWNYAGGAGATHPASPNKLEIATTLLEPSPATSPVRDPFNSRRAELAGTAAPSEKTASQAPSPQAVAVPPRAAELIVATVQNDLTLQATHVGGNRSVALINGAVYAEGDKILSSGATTRSYQVGRISPHRVEVRCDGQTVQLTYSGTEAKTRTAVPSGAAKPNAAKAKPANAN